LKKVLSAIIIIFMLAFMQAYAANDKNSRAVAKQKLSERKAFYQYNGVVQRTHVYPPNIQVLLTKQAELLPLQMRYYWRMADNGRIVTEKALSLGLRDLYLGFMKSDMDYRLSLKT